MNIQSATTSEYGTVTVTREDGEITNAPVGHPLIQKWIDSGVEIAAYVVPAMTWDEVRADRNQLLAETDFHALSDVTMSDEMTAYRQALRDVPSDNADPDDISWPTKP